MHTGDCTEQLATEFFCSFIHFGPWIQSFDVTWQGAVLNSSDRGGIRIQYSRNPFGKKRDYDGSFINTPTAATYTAPAYESSAIAPASYGSAGATTAAAYSSGDYSAPATAPAAADGAQQTNGAAAAYDAAAQPGGHLCNTLCSKLSHDGRRQGKAAHHLLNPPCSLHFLNCAHGPDS